MPASLAEKATGGSVRDPIPKAENSEQQRQILHFSLFHKHVCTPTYVHITQHITNSPTHKKLEYVFMKHQLIVIPPIFTTTFDLLMADMSAVE